MVSGDRIDVAARSARGRRLASGPVALALVALAVVILVVGVRLLTSGSDGSPAAGSSASSSPTAGSTAPDSTATTSAAAASTAATDQPADPDQPWVTLFPPTDLPPDTTRELGTDPSTDWPVAACHLPMVEPRRLQFARGTERGPEYERSLAVAAYADDQVAASVYDLLVRRLAECPTPAGATAVTAPVDLGTAATIVTVSAPVGADATDVARYVVTRSGPVVALALDRATFLGGPPVDPALADRTVDAAADLLSAACSRLRLGRLGVRSGGGP